MKKIALIGCGGIARDILKKVDSQSDSPINIGAVLTRPERAIEARAEFPNVDVYTDWAELAQSKVDLVVEVASHSAVRQYGEQVLRSGADLMVVSVGALADAELLDRLRSAAILGGSHIIIPPGAIGAVDILAAHRIAGLERVVYRSVKPVGAWKGTRAAELLDLDHLKQRTSFFSGSAREAALHFPQNANVTATIALAGCGFDRTVVELAADPGASRNKHELMVESVIGKIDASFESMASVTNPKTSALTALSVLRSLQNCTSWMCI